MKTNISTCARCGKVHLDVEVQQLTRPMTYNALAIATHWAPCPTNGEPILVKVDYMQPEERKL